jgi:hypothetical protein
MALDPETVLVSAAISAVVSGAVSLSTASVVAGRQERGRRRHAARREVMAAVEEVRQGAAEGVLGIELRPQRAAQAMQDEYIWATKVVAAADELGWVRRRQVRRRTRQLVGPFVFDLVKRYPTTERSSASARLSAAASNDVPKRQVRRSDEGTSAPGVRRIRRDRPARHGHVAQTTHAHGSMPVVVINSPRIGEVHVMASAAGP